MDHNEKNQAVDGIEEADVLEIIDHHRLSSIETMGPVFFRNQTLIYRNLQTGFFLYLSVRIHHLSLERQRNSPIKEMRCNIAFFYQT